MFNNEIPPLDELMFDDDNEDCTGEITEKEEKVQNIFKPLIFKEKMKKKIVKKKR